MMSKMSRVMALFSCAVQKAFEFVPCTSTSKVACRSPGIIALLVRFCPRAEATA